MVLGDISKLKILPFVSYMENDFNWHTQPVTDDLLRTAQQELADQEAAL